MRPSRSILGLALLVGLVGPPGAPGAASDGGGAGARGEESVWTAVSALGIDGRGWREGIAPFERLPEDAANTLSETTLAGAAVPAGLSVDFRTDAGRLRLRWTTGEGLGGRLARRAPAALGLDLYLRGADRRWTHVLTATPDGPGPTHERLLFDGLGAAPREFRLYLPIGTPVASVELGVPADATLAPLERPDTEREGPVVLYGGPDLAGLGAPRPGRTLGAVLGRRLGRAVINLGLEAEDLLTLEIGGLLAEINASVFVFDLMDELDAATLDRELEPFLRGLRAGRPWASVLLVDRPVPPRALVDPALATDYAKRQKVQRSVVDRLSADGVGGLHHLSHEELAPPTPEGSVDGTTRGDLAVERTAKVLLRSLEPLVALWDDRRN